MLHYIWYSLCLPMPLPFLLVLLAMSHNAPRDIQLKSTHVIMFNAPYMNYVFSKPYCPAYTNTQANVFEECKANDRMVLKSNLLRKMLIVDAYIHTLLYII